jgi:glutamate formiminotransferase
MTALVECIPNISEGRDAATVAAIASAATSAPGCALLDIHSDPSHHRSVLTLAGAPESVLEGVLRLARAARDRIDLTQHQGAHPRLGALDVVPFVPLAGMTMDDAVALARTAASRLRDELAIPTVLYADATDDPDDRELSALRARPWPDAHPTAGVTAVGARGPLVAYNLFLATDDLAVARRIAAHVRERDGGLPGVKALGFMVRDRAQVSTNLTAVDRTGPADVFAAIQQAATTEGTEVTEGELVGLAPLRALAGHPPEALGLVGPLSRYALEPRLEHVGLGGWLVALSAPNPAPAGVAAAATAAALAASLVLMVAGISRRKTDEDRWVAMEAAARAARDSLLELTVRDAWSVRSSNVDRMNASAAQVAEQAARVVALAEEAARDGYAPARPDAETGALLARAAAEAADRVNTAGM